VAELSSDQLDVATDASKVFIAKTGQKKATLNERLKGNSSEKMRCSKHFQAGCTRLVCWNECKYLCANPSCEINSGYAGDRFFSGRTLLFEA
jgi:hypothetical protein